MKPFLVLAIDLILRSGSTVGSNPTVTPASQVISLAHIAESFISSAWMDLALSSRISAWHGRSKGTQHQDRFSGWISSETTFPA